MSTKAEIRAAIVAKLTGSVDDLTWERHEEFLIDETDSLLENLYGIKTSDSNATTNIVTEVASDKTYTLSFTKVGTRVFVNGNVRNSTGALTSLNDVFFNITTTEYEQQTGTPVYVTGHSASTSEPIKFVLTSNAFAALDTIGINELVEINFSYNTNA